MKLIRNLFSIASWWLLHQWLRLKWYIRFGPRKVLAFFTNAVALHLLDKNCSDFTIHDRDWPRNNVRYEVRAYRFISRGSGVGHTLLQATRRALADMEKKDAVLRYGVAEDIEGI